MARGFLQIGGVDYDETFAPIARYSSITEIATTPVQMGWKIHQMDMKTTFLNGVVEEEIYIKHLEGFDTCSINTLVC